MPGPSVDPRPPIGGVMETDLLERGPIQVELGHEPAAQNATDTPACTFRPGMGIPQTVS